MTDTAAMADVVLPATTHFEADDLAASYGSFTHAADAPGDRPGRREPDQRRGRRRRWRRGWASRLHRSTPIPGPSSTGSWSTMAVPTAPACCASAGTTVQFATRSRASTTGGPACAAGAASCRCRRSNRSTAPAIPLALHQPGDEPHHQLDVGRSAPSRGGPRRQPRRRRGARLVDGQAGQGLERSGVARGAVPGRSRRCGQGSWSHAEGAVAAARAGRAHRQRAGARHGQRLGRWGVLQ